MTRPDTFMSHDERPSCVVCRLREPVQGWVCGLCRTRIAGTLDDLLVRIDQLHLAVVPSPAAEGERVATSRTASPVPARVDVLSLLGPGNESITAMLHPRVRRWQTSRVVTVTSVHRNRWQRQDRQIVDWHRELDIDHATGRPLMVADDDQIGVLPPREWLDSWVRAWRSSLGHGSPDYAPRHRTRPPTDPERVTDPDRVDWWDTHRDTVDPVRDHWEARFGEPLRNTSNSANVDYLKTWLDVACDRGDMGVAEFASELRTLVAEITRVLGDTPDQQWLGRCPTELTERDGTTSVCGAGLWQDPHASQVQCPRCHSTWGQRPLELLNLAAEIRRVWPVDRRRRYTTGELNTLVVPLCPGCANQAEVRWREVTARADVVRWWRPAGVSCPNGCPDVERIM